MLIELFGVARLRAGVERVDVAAATLGAALRALAAIHPQLEPEVVVAGCAAEGFVISLNGDRFVSDPDLPLADRDSLLILGAQVGG